MTDEAVVTKKGQITIPRKIRERFGIDKGSILDFEIKGDKIVKVKGFGKEFVEEWCSIVKNKLDNPLAKELKETFYEQVEEDV